jgi:hypothetical protein
MAAASGGWILAEIHPVRFVSSRIFKQEMDGREVDVKKHSLGLAISRRVLSFIIRSLTGGQ